MNQPNLICHHAIRGRVKVSVMEPVRRGNGKVMHRRGQPVLRTVREYPWQDNLILDSGLDALHHNTMAQMIQTCIAGTGNTPTKDLLDGTYSQSGTTLTRDTGTRDFISGDVGKLFRFNNGVERRITAYTSATQVTVDQTGTVTSQAGIIYRVNQRGLTAPVKFSNTYPQFLWEDGLKSQWHYFDFPNKKTIHRRTYDFSEETGSVNYTEIGFGGSAFQPSITNAGVSQFTVNHGLSSNYIQQGDWFQGVGWTATAYNASFQAATLGGSSFVVNSNVNAGNEAAGTNKRFIAGPLSRILLAGAVTVLAGQLLRVKYELYMTTQGADVVNTEGGIAGWPRPYGITSITASGSAWTVTFPENHHYVSGGKINISGAIRPKTPITAATSDPTTLTITATGHGRSPGDVILIEGMTPSAYNGRWTVGTTPDANTITIASVLNPGTGTVFGTVRQQEPRGTVITAATSNATTLTITAVGHGLSAGQRVVIKGMTPAGYNGNFLIDTTPDADTITIQSTLNPGTGTFFGDLYNNAMTTPPWYDGEWTVGTTPTSPTLTIAKSATPPAAGAGGEIKNNTKRSQKLLIGGFANLANTGSDYQYNPAVNDYISGQQLSSGAGSLENYALPGSTQYGMYWSCQMQAVGVTTPPTGWPRLWLGTSAAHPDGSVTETGLSNVTAANAANSGNNAYSVNAAGGFAGAEPYTAGNFYQDFKLTYGSGSGNRNDIRMITFNAHYGFSGGPQSSSYIHYYMLFDERQRKDSTHKLTLTLRRSWGRDLTTEAS